MRQMLVVAVLVCGGLVLPAAPASAGIDLWEFLSELHGPGPFYAVTLDYRFLCLSRPSDVEDPPGPGTDAPPYVSWLHPFNRSAGIFSTQAFQRLEVAKTAQDRARVLCVNDQRVRGYATINFKYLRSFQNNLFPAEPGDPKHQVKIFDLSASYFARLHNSLDVGTRVGVATFFGKDFDTFRRLSLDAVDVRFYPIAILGDGVQFRAIVMTVGAQLFVPGFVGADFCDPTRQADSCRGLREYNAAPHLLGRWGVGVDIPGLIALLKGR